jgi:signal transduction histidine kinase
LLEDAKVTFLSQPAEAQIEIVTGVENGVPAISMDRSRMLQVLLNLMENARRHAAGINRISLSAARSASDANRLVLRVANNGQGIDPDVVPRMFEPFYTGGNGGSGLGLAIANRIVRAHHGAILLESTGPDGTTFAIELPL